MSILALSCRFSAEDVRMSYPDGSTDQCKGIPLGTHGTLVGPLSGSDRRPPARASFHAGSHIGTPLTGTFASGPDGDVCVVKIR